MEITEPRQPVPAPTIAVLENQGDARGASFSVPAGHLDFLGAAKDLHVASILPGCVRGNHFHVERREMIVIVHDDSWSLHWDEGESTAVSSRSFSGAGAVAVTIAPSSAHAIRNDGSALLWIFAAADGRYSGEAPDSYRREVVAI